VAILFRELFLPYLLSWPLQLNCKEAQTLLVDMTVIVTFIPYVYMFTSLLIIKKKEKLQEA
jgi:amino acid transporter